MSNYQGRGTKGTSKSTFKVANGILHNVHSATACAGEHCVIHNPSDHHMVEWPMVWREDRDLMERICEHGVGHPDPDDLAYHDLMGHSWVDGVHGCDRCCAE